MGTTANNAYPYPELTDVANVPADMRELADAVDLSRNIASRLPTALATTYPAGVSTMYVAGGDSATWPPGGSCVVTTSRTFNNVVQQWCATWTATYTKVWVRNGTATAWGPWVATDSRGAGVIARGRATVTCTSAVAAGVSVTLPTGLFAAAPRVTANTVGSSAWNAYLPGSPSSTAIQIGIRSTDGNAATITLGVDWIAVEQE
jgi:hypothetical protein